MPRPTSIMSILFSITQRSESISVVVMVCLPNVYTIVCIYMLYIIVNSLVDALMFKALCCSTSVSLRMLLILPTKQLEIQGGRACYQMQCPMSSTCFT